MEIRLPAFRLADHGLRVRGPRTRPEQVVLLRSFLLVACALALTACAAGDVGPTAAASPASSPPLPDAGATVGTVDCRHPAGFSTSHPADWSVNPGGVLPVCSWFADRPFVVPEATDALIADVTFTVQAGAGPYLSLPDETARTRVEVAGREALRLEHVAGPGFYPVGTPSTTYVLELPSASAAGDTLVARTVGLPASDCERNVEVLDAMMASLVLDSRSDV